jgi:Holliday junction resolvase
MANEPIPPNPDPSERGSFAESRLAALLEKGGWQLRHHPSDPGPDLVARRKGIQYAVEIKSAPEGRGDRLVPLFAQAVLQAAYAARQKAEPLAVVAAPRVSRRVAEQVMAFAQRYAPHAAAGVIDFEGFAMFRGPQLADLNAERRELPLSARQSVRDSGALFSDLNQWMLKVLLAPELPGALLSAPRGQYRNASQLARAANVSVMSAFRFIQQYGREGYLHESSAYLQLVRREDLFSRWHALSARSPGEAPMRFLLQGDSQAQLRRMLDSGRACLALFAAAEELRLRFVSGVPPYVYVQRIQPANLAAWKNLRPCSPGEPPDLIVREAPAVQSVFRGLVRPEGLAACDVLQVWVDVASHPSRGREQADMIRKRVLNRLIQGAR